MDGFKKIVKMKTGGSVSKAAEYCMGGKAHKKAGGEVSKADIAQDKKVVKKAFNIHDKQLHDGEKTDLSTLKRGGRAKKEQGTVKKYKTGGSVTNVYEAKKSAGDLDNIKKTKDIKPAKAAAPSKASERPALKGSDVEKEKSKPAGHKDSYIKSKESEKSAAATSGAKGGPNKYKTGGGVKKFDGGGSVLTDLKNKIMGTPAQNQAALASEAKYLAAKRAQRAAGAPMGITEQMAMGLANAGQQAGAAMGQNAPAPAPAPAPAAAPAMPAQKRGGKVKKAC